MYLKSSFILILFLVLSCQPVEILRPIEIDTSNFDTISIYSKNIDINKKYKDLRKKIAPKTGEEIWKDIKNKK